MRTTSWLLLSLCAACPTPDDADGDSAGADTAAGDTVPDGDPADTAPADTGESGDTATVPAGFTVSGQALDLAWLAPPDQELAVAIADPIPAFAGGELDVLGTGTTAADGAFSVPGIQTTSSLGLFVVVSGGTSMPTATGIPVDLYEDLTDGDELAGVRAYVVSDELRVAVDASAGVLGYVGTIATDGALFLAVTDNGGSPIEGATVSCGGCDAVYYLDADASDGLFTTGGVANTATVAAAGGLVVVPGAPIATYEAQTSTLYGSQLVGSFPELATVFRVVIQ